MASKRWRLPNTEIDFVLVENGPHAGEFLVSAETVDRLPEFYARVKDLPYRTGPAAQLYEAYRAISRGGSATIHDAYLSSPVGLSYIIPPRWMLGLPGWAKARIAGVALWQWLGLSVGLLIGGLVVLCSHRAARRRVDDSRERIGFPLARAAGSAGDHLRGRSPHAIAHRAAAYWRNPARRH